MTTARSAHEFPSVDLGVELDDVASEILAMHEIYKDEVARDINSHCFDFTYFADRYFVPEYTEVADGQLGDLGTVRTMLNEIATMVERLNGRMTPVRAVYPLCRTLGRNIAEVVAFGDTELVFPDGVSSLIEVKSTNIVVKVDGLWRFHHLNRTFSMRPTELVEREEES